MVYFKLYRAITNYWPILFNRNFGQKYPNVIKLLSIIVNERKFGMAGGRHATIVENGSHLRGEE